jgi:tRNA-dihydrouridine synthase B
MKIADLYIGEQPLLLAPMEDVTDPSFRLLCKEYGADLMYTEFVSSDALVRQVNKTMRKLEIFEKERPVAIQIYGKDPEAMAEATKIAAAANPEIIDLNFGCPVKKVAGKGAGAGLLQDIPRMLAITEACAKAVRVPVTVKTRLGWDTETINIVEVAEQLQDAGAQALTIHGRTRAQMYTGEADWTMIGEVKNNQRMTIPIIGNGDVTTGKRAKECFDRYGVDAVMIGRGAIGQPWIFRDIRHYLEHGVNAPAFTLQEQVDILIRQMETAVNWLDGRRGILHSRRHIAATPAFKGLSHFRQMRIAMLRADTLDEVKALMYEVVEKYQ